jgi:hypothetical protein
MAEQGYQLSEGVLREIKRRLADQALEITNLKRSLAHSSVRRHQVMYLPSLPREVKFRNDSIEDVPPYAVMKVTGGVAGPLITIDKPDTTFCRLYLVNGKSTVKQGQTGGGTWLSESDYVAYNDTDGEPAVGEVWGPKPGQWTLEKWHAGFTIQGHAITVEDVDVVLAVQHHVNNLIGKADADIDHEASGACSVYMGEAGSETDTTWNVTAFNRTEDIAEGDWVSLTCMNGQWYCAGLECPTEEDE